jgi:5-methyltetrahydropteroyltriglutamate--homocysteine methyltransferase
MNGFFTTHVGSLPRPEYLLAAFSEHRKGKLSREEFEKVLHIAVFSVVKMQVETGMDEVNDGEYNRLIFFGDVTSLPGFTQNMIPLEFSAGDTYLQPMVTGKIEYDFEKPLSPIEVQMVKKILKAMNVARRVKVTLPSPSFLALFYPDPNMPVPPALKPLIEKGFSQVKTHYPSLDDYLDDANSIIVNEAEAALRAEADSVQFDSPDLTLWPPTQQRWAIDLNNAVLSKVPRDKTELHVCWGNYENTQANTTGSFSALLPKLYDLKVGTLGPLEIFDGLRDYKELSVFKETPPPESMRLCAGIVSVKTRNVEPVQVLKGRYLALVDAVSPDRAVAAPGCGFASAGESKIISLESAKRKLANLAAAVKEVREAAT